MLDNILYYEKYQQAVQKLGQQEEQTQKYKARISQMNGNQKTVMI